MNKSIRRRKEIKEKESSIKRRNKMPKLIGGADDHQCEGRTNLVYFEKGTGEKTL